MSDWGPFSLNGKNAVVTGGAKGIGLGIAERLAEAGANVLIADMDGEEAVASAEKIGDSYGVKAEGIRLDVTAPDAGETMCTTCVRGFGSIDILVNNAGIYPQVPMLEMTPELFDKVIQVNLKALAFICKAVAKKMIAQGTGGKIVNIASIDGLHPSMVGTGRLRRVQGRRRDVHQELRPRGRLEGDLGQRHRAGRHPDTRDVRTSRGKRNDRRSRWPR